MKKTADVSQVAIPAPARGRLNCAASVREVPVLAMPCAVTAALLPI